MSVGLSLAGSVHHSTKDASGCLLARSLPWLLILSVSDRGSGRAGAVQLASSGRLLACFCSAIHDTSGVTARAVKGAMPAGRYLWQLLNCALAAAYSLHLRGVMETVSKFTVNKTRLDEFSMVYLNNTLSLPPLLFITWATGEFAMLPSEPALQDPMFLLAGASSALLAFGISFASLWFLSTTMATTFGLVGSLNKIPLAVIGLVAFNQPWSLPNVASIAVGLVAGIVFVRAKQQR